ncbi:hypothetical protein [Halobacteriovorax sp. YZS-1-1]|uniref:hypothetical protein n=1 Tax=unclassified Halobacteriovorax TaxID=2639665 RepID=UPI00399AD4D0
MKKLFDTAKVSFYLLPILWLLNNTVYANLGSIDCYNNSGQKVEIDPPIQFNQASCKQRGGNLARTTLAGTGETVLVRLTPDEIEQQGLSSKAPIEGVVDGPQGDDNNVTVTRTETTTCTGSLASCNTAFDISGTAEAAGQSAARGAARAAREEAAGSDDNKTVWNTCYSTANGETLTPDKFKECANSAWDDLVISNISSDDVAYRGSSAARECQAVFAKAANGTDWKDISKDIYSNGSADLDYNKAVAIFTVRLHGDSKRGQEIPSVTVSKAAKKVAACSQLAAVFGENFKEGREQEDPYINPEKLTSMDGKITCNLTGLETLDYDECSALIVAHNSAEIGTAANNTFQQYEAQSLRSEQQQKLMNMDPNSNVTTEALKTQKDNLATQQDMAENRRAIQAARLAAIAGFSAAIPTVDDFLDNPAFCENPVDGAISKFDTHVSQLTTGIGEGKVLCRNLLDGSRFNYFRNGNAKRAGNKIAAEAGVEVAAETMAVSQLGKQKKMIDGAIGKIEGMNTLELPEDFYQNEDVYMQFCTANPTHPDCQTGFGAAVNVPSFGDYNVGGFGTNQAYQPTDTTESTGSAASTTSDPTAANVDTSTAVTKSSPSGGLKGRFGSGATVTEGGGLAQGAGGGGSNPGGGGGGGGSSAGGGGEPQAGATAASGGTKGLSYIGGRGPSFVGGRGIASRRKNTKNDANPFKNMFDKNKNRNLSSLNFKGKAAIGSKSGNLFQRISSAYDKANNKGNLLKYETKSIE